MKILFIVPQCMEVLHKSSVPVGLVSIGTYLKEAGHTVKILDMSVSKMSVTKVVSEFKPDVCGISVRSQKHISSALRISKIIKKRGITVVWGGPFCSIPQTERFFDDDTIDIVCLGEGEMTWLEIVDSFENNRSIDEIKGIAYKKAGKITVTQDREFMDLSEILPADWTLVENLSVYFQGFNEAERILYLYMSKGCPGRCSFCYNAEFHRSCCRRKPVKLFMDELKILVEQFGLDGFYLADEMAFSKKEDLYELCDSIDKAGYRLRWGFQTRIGALDERDLRRAYESGCRWIDFGVETVSPDMIKRIRKNLPIDKIMPTLKVCEDIGIYVMTNFIIGMPGENYENLKYTVDFARKLPGSLPTFMQYCYFYGSPLGKELYESGKYKLPEKLTDYKRADFYFNRMPEFSQVPRKDRIVIQGYFMFKQLFSQKSDGEKFGLGQMISYVGTVFQRLSYLDVRYWPEAVISAGVPFVQFIVSGVFCRKTRKKYGLYESEK